MVSWTGVAGIRCAHTHACVGHDLMHALLTYYKGLITEPCGLPLARAYDHRIHLLPAPLRLWYDRTTTSSFRRRSWKISVGPWNVNALSGKAPRHFCPQFCLSESKIAHGDSALTTEP